MMKMKKDYTYLENDLVVETDEAFIHIEPNLDEDKPFDQEYLEKCLMKLFTLYIRERENNKKIIQINVANNIKVPHDDKLVTKYHLVSEDGKVLEPNLELCIASVDKARVEGDSSELSELLRFWSAKNEEEFEEFSQNNDTLKNMKKDIEKVASDPDFIEFAEYYRKKNSKNS